MRKRVTATLLTGFALAAYGGEPSLELRLGAGDAIGPGFVAQASPESVLTLDVVLSDALAEIDLDTVDLDLNGNPIIGFARKSKTPAGIRLVLDRGRIRHPHLAMAGENRLRFAARDLDGNRYRGEFVVRVSQGVGGVQLPSGPGSAPGRAGSVEAEGPAARDRDQVGCRGAELEAVRADPDARRVSLAAARRFPQGRQPSRERDRRQPAPGPGHSRAPAETRDPDRTAERPTCKASKHRRASRSGVPDSLPPESAPCVRAGVIAPVLQSVRP